MTRLTKEEKKRKAEELDNSRPLDVWKVSDYPQVKAALKHVFAEMKEERLTTKRYEAALKDHIRVIVLDLYVAHKADPTMYISYSRNSNAYKKGTRYDALFFNFTQTIKVVDFLNKHGYIEHEKGFFDKSGASVSKQSRMKATDALIKLIDGYEITMPMIRRHEDEELIILKDRNKKPIDYEDTELTIQIRENLKIINSNLERHSILLYIKDTELKALNERLRRTPGKIPIDFTKKRLHRIFNNGSFTQGGRFYGGWWQNIPREYRKYIRVNDKDTVELDYSGLHINMLYAMEELPMPEGDVYALDGYSNDSIFREFVKRMLLVMVNSVDRAATRKALHKEVHYEKTLELPEEIKSVKKEDLYPLMDAFEEKHEGIKHYLNSGKGIDLQYFDSQLAEKVMLHFSDKMKYAILPMHDSFILHHGLEEELEDEMAKAFYDMFGQEIEIGVKYRSIEERQKEQGDSKEDSNGLCRTPVAELLALDKEYSVYATLLQHQRSTRL